MTKDDIRTKVQNALQQSQFRGYIQKVSLFGSHLHNMETQDSDIDLLVEFSTPVSYFDIADIEHELETYLGTHVDLVTPEALSTYFRDDVLQEAETLYEG